MIATIATIYHAQPQVGRIAILCRNYGETGAVNLYGAADGLPKAISGVNSYWRRGYGAPIPDTIILVGFDLEDAAHFFADPIIAGRVTNPYGVENEESRDHPDIFVCHRPRWPWPELWKKLRSFG